MKLFTEKDNELLINITRSSLKIIILIAMFLVLTTIPGIILTGILYILSDIPYEEILPMRTKCWTICMLISFIGILIKLSQEENVK